MSLPPLVDAAWVQEHLGEPGLVLGDVRGPNAHGRGHLPRSIPLVLGSPPPLADREIVHEFAVEVQRRPARPRSSSPKPKTWSTDLQVVPGPRQLGARAL